MEVFTDIENIDITKSAICVGTFDGLHKGHQTIINQTIKQAKRLNAKSIVFTFWPHPHEIIFPNKTVYYLNTFQEKIDLFSKSGIDYLILYPFDKTFANKTSKEFIDDFLIKRLKMKFFVIGYDHQFGKEREGKYETLKNVAQELDFGIERIEQQSANNVLISSTKIRSLIKEGELELANQLLGYTYFISGKVIRGQQIGSSIGFPTANIQIAQNKIMPQVGVYCIEAKINNKIRQGIANVGFKPTVEESRTLSLEVHFFDFHDNIYHQELSILFYKKIRDEQKFNSLSELKQQITKDKQIGLTFFKNLNH